MHYIPISVFSDGDDLLADTTFQESTTAESVEQHDASVRDQHLKLTILYTFRIRVFFQQYKNMFCPQIRFEAEDETSSPGMIYVLL